MKPILQAINLLVDGNSQVLNKNVDFENNIACQLRDVDFTTASDYFPEGNFTLISFPSNLNTKVRGVTLIKLQKAGQTFSKVGEAFSPEWTEANKQILIPWISGLENETRYLATFLVL